MRTREYIDGGMDPAAARRKAERRFGDIGRHARRRFARLGTGRNRQMQRTEYLSELRQDVALHVASAAQESGLHGGRRPDARARHRRHDRHLQRGLRRRPAAAAAARSGAADGRRRDRTRALPSEMSAGNYTDAARRRRRPSKGCRRRTSRASTSPTAPTPERVIGARVTANYFDVMGVRPLLGRTFTRRRRSAGQRARRRPQPSPVDAALRRQPLDGRQHDPHERRRATPSRA